METTLTRLRGEPREIVKHLRSFARTLGGERDDQVREKVGKYWIGLRSAREGRVFAEIRPTRSRVEVFIRPAPRSLRDPGGLARRAPPTQGWGWFRTRFSLTSVAQVDDAAVLLRQSYEAIRGFDGRGPRPSRRRRQTSL